VPELPYFPFYGSDWLGDSKVRRMPLEARAVHIDLICHSWDIGPIPADPDEASHLLGLPVKKFKTLWPKVEVCWESDGNGGFLNPRLEKVRAKQRAKRKGRKSDPDE
jgi:hypothetical protein